MENGFILDGKYQILSVLGEGGAGKVYKARHLLLHDIRAIKEIKRSDHENVEIIWERLRREISILRKLDHSGIPRIIDVAEKPEALYIVMEYVEGKSLNKILESRGCLSPGEVLETGMKILDLLSYLHSRTPPVIHRDLKPSNIMIRKDGSPVLIDFGSASEMAAGIQPGDSTGTRAYAAPEQFEPGGKTDPRTDIFCFGMTLAVMLTGLDPGKPGILDRPLCRWNPAVSPEFETMIRTCIKKEPGERYADCRELKETMSLLRADYRRRLAGEWKKLIIFFSLLFLAISALAVSVIFRTLEKCAKNDLISEYTGRAAIQTSVPDAAPYYVKALKVAPAEKKIYKEICRTLILPGHFTSKEAAILIDTLYTPVGDKAAIKRYREASGEDYLRTCYEIGIGFFYEMGGPVGKKESQTWFAEAAETKSKGIPPDMRKRAECYRKISAYYARFATGGMDQSGESEEDYEDFFKTLHELNQIKIRKTDGSARAAVAYMISKEILLEIGFYGQEFLSRDTITREMLVAEIDAVRREDGSSNPRWILMKKYRSKKEMDELRLLLLDTRGKLNNMSE